MDLTDRTVLLTGATDGIGRATAVRLAPRVGTLIVHGLEPEDAVGDLLETLRRSVRPGGEVRYFGADFGVLADIVALGDAVRSVTDELDLLINNAGRPGAHQRTLSADGIEATLQTNYLSVVALTTTLLDRIGRTRRGRVLNIASATHLSAALHLWDLQLSGPEYSAVTAYAQSKLAIVTYSCWLAARLGGQRSRTEVASMHPGVIATRLLTDMFSVTGDPPEHAAANIVHVATLPGSINGAYFDERRRADPNPIAENPAAQRALLDRTEELLSGVVDTSA